jgi:hypothetical protein
MPNHAEHACNAKPRRTRSHLKRSATQNTLTPAMTNHAEHHLQRPTTQNTLPPATLGHAEHIAACKAWPLRTHCRLQRPTT